MFDFDVFILGGGPAGLATAMAARALGLRAMVADAAQPPIDKPCGEGLMPDALEAARAVGFEVPEDAGKAFRGIRFVGPAGNAVEAEFPQGIGIGVRRTVLHRLLVEQASRASGLEMRWGVPVTGIDGHAVRLGSGGTRVSARYIVGADGGQSLMRRWAGLESFRRQSRRYGFRRHYRIAPWTDKVEIHWGRRGQFYITPVAGDEVCVVAMSRDPHLRVDEALEEFPLLERRLKDGAAVTAERGSPAATCRLKRVVRGHIALVGDASGTVDAITGEGVSLAFHQAIELARAMAEGDLERYQQAHSALGRRPVFMADFMLTMDRWPALQRRVLPALEARPKLFAELLAMHVGRLSWGRFAGTAANLGWGVLFP